MSPLRLVPACGRRAVQSGMLARRLGSGAGESQARRLRARRRPSTPSATPCSRPGPAGSATTSAAPGTREGIGTFRAAAGREPGGGGGGRGGARARAAARDRVPGGGPGRRSSPRSAPPTRTRSRPSTSTRCCEGAPLHRRRRARQPRPGRVRLRPRGRGRDACSPPRARRSAIATNNVAEYRGLVAGLARAVELAVPEVEVRSDSELMVKQMRGEYRVKNEALRALSLEAGRLARQLGKVDVRPRDARAERARRPARQRGARRRLARRELPCPRVRFARSASEPAAAPVGNIASWLVTIDARSGASCSSFQAEVAKPFRIPSSSMEPTLHCARPSGGCEAEFSTVCSRARSCLRFTSPKRGQIVVFSSPPAAKWRCGEGGDYVKRLVGMPGDR